MAKMIQFRYYGENNPNNAYPKENAKTWQSFCADLSFRSYAPIHQFGIQTLPGTRIYINQSNYPVIIGGTGIFEIDCDKTTAAISSFRVEQESMEAINNNDHGYLVIDLIYGKEED